MARIIILIWGFSQHDFRKSELRQIGTTGNLRITRMRSFLLDVFPWLVGKSVIGVLGAGTNRRTTPFYPFTALTWAPKPSRL
jgi:hypothetical protein